MTKVYGSLDRWSGERASIGSETDGWKRAIPAAIGGVLLALSLRRRSLGGAAAVVVGWLVYRRLEDRRDDRGVPADATETERSITIGKPADELYEAWRDPERLTQIVGRVADASTESEDRVRWTARGPLGRDVTWETRIAEERPGEYLRWESVEGATVAGEGSVRFRPAPGDRGTEVTLRLRFDPPGGALGDTAMARLGVVPDALAMKALRRFKSLAETGEIPTLEGNPSARGEGDVL